MTHRKGHLLLAALLLSVVPLTASAQLGALKNKLAEKTGMSRPAEKPAVQWKEGERPSPLTAADLDAFLTQWKADLKYNAMSEAERQRMDEQRAKEAELAAEKHEKWDQCTKTSLSPNDMMAMSQKMQQRMMQLAQSGDQNAAQKAGEEYQKAVLQLVEKKCGPEPKNNAASETRTQADVRTKEWFGAYLMVRKDRGPDAAGKIILASPDEVKLIESRLAQLEQLARQDGLVK